MNGSAGSKSGVVKKPLVVRTVDEPIGEAIALGQVRVQGSGTEEFACAVAAEREFLRPDDFFKKLGRKSVMIEDSRAVWGNLDTSADLNFESVLQTFCGRGTTYFGQLRGGF